MIAICNFYCVFSLLKIFFRRILLPPWIHFIQSWKVRSFKSRTQYFTRICQNSSAHTQYYTHHTHTHTHINANIIKNTLYIIHQSHKQNTINTHIEYTQQTHEIQSTNTQITFNKHIKYNQHTHRLQSTHKQNTINTHIE